MLLWFFVNLALVGALAFAFVQTQFRIGLEWLLAGPAMQRIEAISEIVTAELRERPEARWNEVLERNRAAHGVEFAVFRNDARQVAGPPIIPPDDLKEKLKDRRGPPNPRAAPSRGKRDEARRTPPQAQKPPPARLAFFLRTGEPARYWAGVHIGITHEDPENPRPVTLLIVADSIIGAGLFFDPLPWLVLGGIAMTISALVWMPIVGGISRAVRRVNTAARSIAEGRFDVRVPEKRRDELGELGSSVNMMAAQLGELVTHQRRLTADVAHELCSPIARMQRALGIVEQRSVPEQAAYLQKLDRELQHMARLVEEVLSFSKASTLPTLASPEDVALGPLMASIVAREAADAKVEVAIPIGLQVRTLREALDRAVSNIVRNAVRYAAHAGPISVTVLPKDGGAQICIRDLGPGVPRDAVKKIFEPFYRPEAARQRTTGGAGLGLAIVKRCIDACNGTVCAANRVPVGFEVTILVPEMAEKKPAQLPAPAS